MTLRRATTIIIGAGSAGLAMSRCLSDSGIDHLILERGDVANSWRTERWESLRLLTPNWQSRLPGDAYDGPDPDGFMTMPQIVGRLARYAGSMGAPVHTRTGVTRVQRTGTGYALDTTGGPFACETLVLASGACNLPALPRWAEGLPAFIHQVTPLGYRRAGELPEGGVLVVGASATGVQLAREIRRSGRPVTLAAGEHVRVPRSYRGRDIHWWMDAMGSFDMRIEDTDDPARARRVPSLQLVGERDLPILDLNALQADGIEIVGRLCGVRDGRAQFSGGLANVCALADLKMGRLLDAIDDFAARSGLDAGAPPPHRHAPTRVPDAPRLDLDLAAAGIRTVVWATGYRPDYAWLDVPVLDARGRLRHRGGVVDAPGLYALGLPFMRTRKSTLIDGVGDDARALSQHIRARLARRAA